MICLYDNLEKVEIPFREQWSWGHGKGADARVEYAAPYL
jgi:hypothetical protein